MDKCDFFLRHNGIVDYILLYLTFEEAVCSELTRVGDRNFI